jgi:hypothetical protein
MNIEQRLKIKHLHEFTRYRLRSWFPLLPSCEAFNMRINRVGEALRNIADVLLQGYFPPDCDLNISLVDSLPIITCSGKRTPTVTKEITDKGYCSTKRIYFYGLILHALAFHWLADLPFPESIVITLASENDLNAHNYSISSILRRLEQTSGNPFKILSAIDLSSYL